MSRGTLLASLSLFCMLSFSACLSCLDRNGNSVAWFNALKYPNNMTKDSPRYAYVDANTGSSFQVISGVFIDDKTESLYSTIDTINTLISASSSDLNLLIFNDEGPDYNGSSHARSFYSEYTAHAKGIVAYDNSTKTGIYIQHSFPKYPNINYDGTIYATLPKNTYDYGQNVYCMSLDETSMNQIYANFPIANYVTYVNTGFFADMPNTSSLGYLVTQFSLLNGDTQYMITKNPHYKGFLYDDIVSPYFKSNFAVESWGRPYMKSKCSGAERTVNVMEVAINSQDRWGNHDDHSKWAVSTSNQKIGCNCDMNRQLAQERRGGSCFCSTNANLYNALYSIVARTAKCDDERREFLKE